MRITIVLRNLELTSDFLKTKVIGDADQKFLDGEFCAFIPNSDDKIIGITVDGELLSVVSYLRNLYCLFEPPLASNQTIAIHPSDEELYTISAPENSDEIASLNHYRRHK